MEKLSLREACDLHNTQKTLNRCPAQTLTPTFLGESSLHPKSLLPPLGLTSLTQLQNLRAEGNLRYPPSWPGHCAGGETKAQFFLGAANHSGAN